MNLPFLCVREGACLPQRATPHSAGLDLCACIDLPMTVLAGESCVIPTGLAAALPQDTVGLIFGRSGLGIRHGIVPSNAVGVIDADYRGEIVIGLRNQSAHDYIVMPQERIAQLVVLPVLMVQACLIDALPPSQRDAGGIGSTGRI